MRRTAILALVTVGLLAACSGKSFAPSTERATLPSGQPGKGRPPVTLGDKNFTEQFILGELYAQALRAKGYTVHLQPDIGPSGVIDTALIRGRIDLYPEYTGVIISALQNITLAAPGAPAPGQAPPRSARQAYEQAASFEDGRGFELLNPTPFQNADRLATTPALAKAHGLRTMQDLARLGSFTYGGPPENRTRYEGLRGMQQAYGLNRARFVGYPIGAQYEALSSGKVDTIAVFTTDGRLLHGAYAVLSDPRNIFGFQNVAPVVSKRVLSMEGPAFARTLNAVSATLSTEAIQKLNAAVDVEHRIPREVARSFLAANLLK
ncbi:MAG: glycine betaine ABC transporter substrate-binding protein [Solirubrobacteraceae bacterium]